MEVKNKKLIIVVTSTEYHPDASGGKTRMREFDNLKEAENYYFEKEKNDCIYHHTAVSIYVKEGNE
jgi:hypothetical protein